MEESRPQEVIPQQEAETESVKRSEMCIGLNCMMMTVPKDTVTDITIMTTIPIDILKKTQLVTVTNTTLTKYM